MEFSPRPIALGLALGVLSVVGCSSQPLPPELPEQVLGLPDQFSATGTQTVGQRWWQSFDDTGLDQLVRLSLASNPDLEATYWRLQQADAVAAQARSGFWPRLTGALENTERRSSASNSSGSHNTGNSWGGSLAAGYEVDLWGRVRSGARAAEAGRLAQEENLQVAALTLAAAVADTWLQLQEQWGQLRLLEQQLDVNEKTLRVLELRFGGGVTAAADVLQQRQLVQTSLQEQDQARANVQVLMVQLAALLGTSTEQLPAFVHRDGSLPLLPALPATGVPSQLLLRRPDVRRAQRDLLQGHYLADQAWAARLPSLTFGMHLTGGGGVISHITDDWLLTLTTALEGVIFDGGNLAAVKRQQKALEQERWAAFRNTVTQALAEVEQALINEQAIRDRLYYLQSRAALADQITLRQRRAYGHGTVDFLNVLAATNNQQSLERQLLTARRELLVNRVTLYRSLSGGVMQQDLPEPPAIELDVYEAEQF